MFRDSIVVSATGLVLVIGASLAAGDVQAVTVTRVWSANPSSYCQAALPVFEGAIRKRPLAVQNEGSTNAFITCSMTRNYQTSSVTRFQMYAQTLSGAVTNLSCTFVAGYATGAIQSVVKTVALPANGSQGSLTWEAADFTGGVFPDTQYNLSCNLLPGVGLNDSYLAFQEDVGA